MRRRLSVVAGSAALALAIGTLSGTSLEVGAAAAVVSAAPVNGQADSYEDAYTQAVTTGARVENVSARTETVTEYVNPDGTVSRLMTASPIRFLKSGVWQDIDTSLVLGDDGLIRPRSAVIDVAFSNGGSSPFASLNEDGASVRVSWPGTLGTPVIAGDSATYREVLPGVDLVVRAFFDRFSEYLVVKSAAAAALPQLTSIRFGLEVDGATVVDTSDGGCKIVDSSGRALVTSPQPAMWDSGSNVAEPSDANSYTPPAEAITETPEPGDKVKAMDVVASSTSLTLNPDPTLLKGTSTTYPVIIDPTYSTTTTPDPTVWTLVSKTYPSSTYYKFTGDQGVGYYVDSNSSPTTDTKRQYYSFDISSLIGKGATVVGAIFGAKNVYSGTCTAKSVTLNKLSASFTSTTTWSNKPGQTALESKSFSYGRTGCATATNVSQYDTRVYWGAGTTSNPVTVAVQERVTAGATRVYLGLSASETDSASWKRFTPDTTLEVRYNVAPKAPASLTATVGGGAVACSTTTYAPASTGSITMSANLTDADTGNTLTGTFTLRRKDSSQAGGYVTVDTRAVGPKAQGTFTTGLVAVSVDGQYEWMVTAKDNYNATKSSSWCRIDMSSAYPEAPAVADTDTSGVPKIVNQPVTFSVTRPANATTFKWALNGTDLPSGNGTPFTVAVGGQQTFTVTPTTFGDNYVSVWAISQYLNPSSPTTTDFAVQALGPVAAWSMDDDLADGKFNASVGAGDLVVNGSVSRVNGYNWTSDPGPGSAAIGTPSGAGSLRVTSPHNGTGNLTAAALAYPLSTANSTVLSFNGTAGTVVRVGIETVLIDGVSSPRWVARAIGSDPSKTAVVYSDDPVSTGQWSHVAIVVTPGAPSGPVHLYVNGIDQTAQTPTFPDTFAMPAITTFWVGSGASVTTPVLQFQGYVDEVKVHQGAVDSASLFTEGGQAAMATWPSV